MWGGECVCPDGQTFLVGDRADFCGSLACYGGRAGKCHRDDQRDWRGRRVTCGKANGQSEMRLHISNGQGGPELVRTLLSPASPTLGRASRYVHWAESMCIADPSVEGPLCFEVHAISSESQSRLLDSGCMQQLAQSLPRTSHATIPFTLAAGVALSFRIVPLTPPPPPRPPDSPGSPLLLPPPPPPLSSTPPPAGPPVSIIDRINKRFAHGKPTKDYAEAGVFVSQFDGMRDPSSPWLPCAAITTRPTGITSDCS